MNNQPELRQLTARSRRAIARLARDIREVQAGKEEAREFLQEDLQEIVGCASAIAEALDIEL